MNIWNNRDWHPMLLNTKDKAFDDSDFIYEIKFDGIRAIIFASVQEIQIMSRNNEDLTKYFPELASIKDLVKENTIFDGELVAFENGKPNFRNVMKRIRLKNNLKIANEAKNNSIVFVAFDILYKKNDLRCTPLIDRKVLLSNYPDTDVFVKCKYIKEKGVSLFKEIKRLKLEGIVAKNINGLYHINKRTDDFIKIKNLKVDDFYIGGYEEKKKGIISLALGEYRDNKLIYVGRVSVGKNKRIYEDVVNSKKSHNYFNNYDDEINYIKPLLMCRVEYLERTSSNNLRHPKYRGL